MVRLVIYKNDTYEVVNEYYSSVLIRRPFTTNIPFSVSKNEVSIYPRTYDYILDQWIPNCDPKSGIEPYIYLLEIYHALLSPKFLLVPKDPGVYTALWMDEENKLEVTWVLYSPEDSALSDSDQMEGYDTFLIHKRMWIPLRYYIANSKFRYLRFIPFSLSYTYMYLKHLIETEHFTQEEVEQIWKRDRNSSRGLNDALRDEQKRDQDQHDS